MVNRSNLKVFGLQWIIANTIAASVGFSLLEFIKDPEGFSLLYLYVLSPSTLNSPILIIASILIGVTQWLALRNRISRLHPLWIVTNIVGLFISAFIIFFIADLINLASLRQISSPHRVREIFVLGAFGGGAGGILIGIAQCLVLQKWADLILINGVAWSFAWAIALAIGTSVGRLLFFNLNIELSTPIQLMMFGSILGFVSSLITGTYLVRLLKRDYM
jgi:hypothetical protein